MLSLNSLGHKDFNFSQKERFNQKLSSITTNDPKNVEISWLEDDGNLKKGFLKEEFISQLFNSNKSGYPLLDEKETKGNSLVIKLFTNNCSRFLYVKFYPEYPLRQEFVDEFCYRLSGFGSYSKLVKLRYLKPEMTYCVLMSEPLGEDNYSKLEDILEEQDGINFDNNLNSFYFTWNFFETYLLQPRDNKEDNVAIQKASNGSFVYTSFDADLTLGHKLKSNIDKQPNVFSVVYLTNQMNKPCHRAVLKALLQLDFDNILIEILEGLVKKYRYLIEPNTNASNNEYLFNKNEFSSLKQLLNRGKIKGYKVTCFLDSCFPIKISFICTKEFLI
jgi:hypothetical protein